MNYLLIPLILASNIHNHNEQTWEFGPEYYFELNMNMIADLKRESGHLMGSHMIANLACRPKPSDTLMCRVWNASITKISPKSFGASAVVHDANAEYKAFGIGGKQFSIQFNEKGVLSLQVEDGQPPLTPDTLNIFRLIANQFNIGLIPNTPHFMRWENSTVGECNAHNQVSRQSVHTNNLRYGSVVADMTIVPGDQFPRLSNDTVVEVTKSTDPANCRRQAVYGFATRYIYGIVLRDVINKLKSSVTRLAITESSYLSETVYESDLFDADQNNLGKVLDQVIVKLVSVKPAEEELPLYFSALSKEIIVDDHDKMSTFF